MADLREAILTRLLEVGGAVDGVKSAVRNSLDVSKLQRPAVVILDGAEQLRDAPLPSRGQVVQSLQRMELAPLIAVHIRANNAVDAGALLSLYRSRLLWSLFNDAELLGLLGNNGDLRYEGASVAAPAPEGTEHRIDLIIALGYVLNMADLAP